MKISGIEITGLANTAQQVKPGYAFFAIRGNAVDGTTFIPMAQKYGAAVMVTDKSYKGESYKVDDVRKFLAECAVQFYQPLPKNIITVTGTAGKSSTVNFCAYILENLGKNAASIGSLGMVYKGKRVEVDRLDRTNPDPIDTALALHALKIQECDYVAIEASSHGIDQDRMTALPIKVAAFTNFSRDHLEYHKTMQNYFSVKKRLFTDVLAPDGVAVLNADDPKFSEFSDINRKIISYGVNGKDIKLINAEYSPTSQKVKIEIHGKEYEYELDAPGGFQAYNSMCAIGMVIGLGFSADKVVKAINHAKPALGRMQYAGSPVKDGGIYVDFAHTPDAFEKVLASARGFTKNHLRVILSTSGGGRDPGKRPIMGEVCYRLADVVYITDESPYNEDPAQIRAQIAAGCPNAIVIDGRANAIKRAICDMEAGDILILGNKGHEDHCTFGTTKMHFSDFEEVQKVLDSMK